jgi:hypothetical protein
LDCIEKLRDFICNCGSSHDDLKIMDFEELPELEKFEFDWYDKDKDFILYCEVCKTYTQLYSDSIDF